MADYGKMSAEEILADLKAQAKVLIREAQAREERIHRYFGSPETNEKLAQVARETQALSTVRRMIAKEQKTSHYLCFMFPMGLPEQPKKGKKR